MTTGVRAATAQDAAALAALYSPYVTDTAVSFEERPPSPAEIVTRMTAEPRLPWLVAWTEGPAGDPVVVGYAYASTHRSRAAYRWSVDCTVYLDPAAQRAGWGRRLYARLLSERRELGYLRVFAGITQPNAASVGLHEAMGFTAVGVYRNVGFKLGRWHDVGWWGLELGAPPTAPSTPRPWDPAGSQG